MDPHIEFKAIKKGIDVEFLISNYTSLQLENYLEWKGESSEGSKNRLARRICRYLERSTDPLDMDFSDNKDQDLDDDKENLRVSVSGKSRRSVLISRDVNVVEFKAPKSKESLPSQRKSIIFSSMPRNSIMPTFESRISPSTPSDAKLINNFHQLASVIGNDKVGADTESMTSSQLSSELQRFGLSTSGTKMQKKARLEEFLQSTGMVDTENNVNKSSVNYQSKKIDNKLVYKKKRVGAPSYWN
eukprot:TRINITY_DN6342_c0_g1_i1.p1 TRINITY_DN6342_c0_g1~~TRINITY_DN6342_c0_g1_i1.p1  ORF type:complete len:258 (+),score=52.95 TRINITY_DN6342_c0_g1_i1:43-774(+)